MQLITLVLFSSTLALALGFGMPGVPKQPSGDQSEKMYYSCFRDVTCGVLGEKAENNMADCLNELPSRDVDEIIKSIERLGYKDMGTRELPKICRYFCPKEEGEKKSTFKACLQDLVDHLSKYCPSDANKCEDTNTAITCVRDRLNEHQAKEECKPED